MGFGLTLDAVTINRPASTSDAEGNVTAGFTLITNTARGTWGMPTDTDRQVADRRGELLDATLALDNGIDIKPGDVVTCRSQTWVVTAVRDVRIHQRAFLRRAQ